MPAGRGSGLRPQLPQETTLPRRALPSPHRQHRQQEQGLLLGVICALK